MNKIKSSEKLGILIPGLNGAVSTTFITGTLLIAKNLAKPIGSFTQMGRLKIKNEKNIRTSFKINELFNIVKPDELIFGGWDIRNENCFQSACENKVLEEGSLRPVKEELENIKPMPAVFDNAYVKRLNGSWIKRGVDKLDLMDQIREDIKDFKKAHNVKNNCCLVRKY